MKKSILIIALTILVGAQLKAQRLPLFEKVSIINLENHKDYLPSNFIPYDFKGSDKSEVKSYVNAKGQIVVFQFSKSQLKSIYTYSEDLLPKKSYKYPYDVRNKDLFYLSENKFLLHKTKSPNGEDKWIFYSTKFIENRYNWDRRFNQN